MRDKDSKLYHKQIGLNALLAVLSGALLVLAFPKAGFYPLAWIALVPLLIVMRNARPVGAFFLGLLTGFVFALGLLYWIALFGYLPWILLSLGKALFIAVFALFANIACRRSNLAVLAIPALWTAMAWSKTLGTYGFPWGSLANSQAHWLPIIQIASITGVWGVTFLIVVANVAIAGLIVERNRRSKTVFAFAALLVFIIATGGLISMNSVRKGLKPDKSIALVQGNVELTWPDPALIPQIYESYWPLTESIGKSDFIVWPETSLPGDLESSPILQSEIARLARLNSCHMIMGGEHKESLEYNAAYLVDPTGKLTGVYYKVHLVPFGEFVPGRKVIPFIDKYPIMPDDRTPGPGFHSLKCKEGDLGVMICFESIFPQIARKLTKSGAQMLIVITNDSWFKRTAAAAQHHDNSILMAVANRRYVARNATTGISSIIDPTGREIASVGLGKRAVVRGNVGMMTGRSIYTTFGDWFAYLCTVFGLFAIVVSLRKPYKMKGHSR